MKLAGVVLAAGVGQRMAPLSEVIPKPLLPVLDRSLLQRQIGRLKRAGVEQVYVNTHHGSAAVGRHLRRVAPDAVDRFEPQLSGPAGALLLFADLLSGYDAVLVTSGDILLEADLGELVEAHRCAGAALTFGVVESTGAHRFGVLEIDAGGLIHGAREKPDVPEHELFPVSAGVYCLGPEAIAAIGQLRRSTATVDFARDLAPSLLAAGARVAGHRFDGYWRDVGTPSSFLAANRDALYGKVGSPASSPGLSDSRWTQPVYVHPSVAVEDGVRLEAPVVVGAGARLGARARIANSVVLPGSFVPAEVMVVGGIVATGSAPLGAPAPSLVGAGGR